MPHPSAASGRGCANSFDLAGATLSATGTLAPDTLVLACEIGPSYIGFAFLIEGDARAAAGIASGDGVRCVDGLALRFGAHDAGSNGDAAGTWSYPNTAQTTAISAATLHGAGIAHYQLVDRNAAAGSCSSGTTNWSSGISVDWRP